MTEKGRRVVDLGTIDPRDYSGTVLQVLEPDH